jgi:hypothetical protein
MPMNFGLLLGVWVALASGCIGDMQMTTGAGSLLECALMLMRLWRTRKGIQQKTKSNIDFIVWCHSAQNGGSNI